MAGWLLICFTVSLLARQSTAARRTHGHFPRRPRGASRIESCSDLSIHVLDLNIYAQENGIPTCDLEKDVKIDPRNGIPFLPEAPGLKYLEKGAPISMAAHGGPWHLREAILSSNYATDDLNAADIVFVYDHCYYMRWLGQVHTIGAKGENEESESGEWLIKGFRSLVKTERWQRNNGSDFVIFDPHPGFTDGRSDLQYKDFVCNMMRNSMHIVVETGQRNICKDYWTIHEKMLIAPYVAGSADTSKPLLGFKQPVLPMKLRPTLLHFQASCLPYGYMYHNQTKITTGKVLRHAAALALGSAGPDVDVHCTDNFLAGQHESFEKVVEKMRSSLFCLVLPGDSASARRTSEIIMTGCIPVFLGPPYGTMPFPDDFDYKSTSMFFNVTQHRQWLDSDMLWEMPHDERPGHVQNPWYWMPDADVLDKMITVDTMQDILGHLRGMPEEHLAWMLDRVATERHKYAYRQNLQQTPSAVSVIMSNMCTLKKGPGAATA